MKTYSIKEIIDEFLPKGTPQTELHDFKMEIFEKLYNILVTSNSIKDPKEKSDHLYNNVEELIKNI